MIGKLIRIVIIVITVAGESLLNSAFAMGERRGEEKMTFRFEDYDTLEEMQAALYRLHPVGSDIKALHETLEKAGATYRPEVRKEPKYQRVRLYRYRKGIFGWGGYGITAIHNFDDGKIEVIEVYKVYEGL